MPELILVRHAQASFGAADYDVLSDLGHRQARALGQALAALGLRPDAVFSGAQRRHRETWEGMKDALGHAAPPAVLPGFDEFDFKGLLDARFAGGGAPAGLHDDRREHFRILRDTVLQWQKGEIADPPESYAAFADRVRDARRRAAAGLGKTQCALVVTSGGALGQSVAEIMNAPADAMIRLQLQVRNCSVTRVIATSRAEHLNTFNEMPHVTAGNAADFLTYS